MKENVTTKFEISFFKVKKKRDGKERKLKHFVYQQNGYIQEWDSNGKRIGGSVPFNDFGKMLSIMNKSMRKHVMKEFIEEGRWNN